MFTRKPHLQLEKFGINGAKRLLQHNRHLTDLSTCQPFCPLSGGEADIRESRCLLWSDANDDPQRTSAQHAHRPHPVECDDISRCEADQVETGG